MAMTHLTNAMLTAVVNDLPGTFDSHQVIRGLMIVYPQEYVRELYECVADPDPILAAHAAIGQSLYDVPGIEAAGEVKSVTVRGTIAKNKLWRKKK
jgi:hypothetical protein